MRHKRGEGNLSMSLKLYFCYFNAILIPQKQYPHKPTQWENLN
jgi:hypothetical protein